MKHKKMKLEEIEANKIFCASQHNLILSNLNNEIFERGEKIVALLAGENDIKLIKPNGGI